MTTKRISLSALFVMGAITLLSSAAIAQPPGGGGGFNMPPGMMEKIKALQKYAKEHAKVTELGQTIYKIGKVNEEDELKLDKKQSVAMLAVINSYKSKTALTEDEAGTASKKMTGLLSQKQIKKMVTIPSPWARGGGGRPGGGAPGGGGGPKMGGPGGKMPTIPDPPKGSYNPFNPESLPGMMKEMSKKNLSNLTDALAKQSH